MLSLIVLTHGIPPKGLQSCSQFSDYPTLSILVLVVGVAVVALGITVLRDERL